MRLIRLNIFYDIMKESYVAI